MKKYIPFLFITLLAAACNSSPQASSQTPAASKNPITPAASSQTVTPQPKASNAAEEVVAPVDMAEERIVKKFFGTYVTPQNSPVQPERFRGYHTGLDFETFPEEKNTDVAVKVICSGKLVRLGRASGYGGYVVQACTINHQTVTVVYGHLRESSILGAVGRQFSAATQPKRMANVNTCTWVFMWALL
jgi:hypothetical protein